MFSHFTGTDLAWLIAAGVVFTAFTVFGIRQIVRANSDMEQIITEETTLSASTSIPTIHSEVSATMRGTFESSEERSSLIDLVSAMVGFGPTAPHGNVRKVAERVMGERVYTTFFRTFLTVFELPQGMPLSDRTVFELSSYPQDLLLNDDNVLTFLVTYAPCVNDFYMQTSTDNRVTQHLPGFITMSSLLDKLVAVHRKFYAG